MSSFDSVAVSWLVFGLFLMAFPVFYPAKWEGRMRNQNWRMGVFWVGPALIILASAISIVGDLT